MTRSDRRRPERLPRRAARRRRDRARARRCPGLPRVGRDYDAAAGAGRALRRRRRGRRASPATRGEDLGVDAHACRDQRRRDRLPRRAGRRAGRGDRRGHGRDRAGRRRPTRWARADGWGTLLGDDGGGYWIGRRALAMALRAPTAAAARPSCCARPPRPATAARRSSRASTTRPTRPRRSPAFTRDVADAGARGGDAARRGDLARDAGARARADATAALAGGRSTARRPARRGAAVVSWSGGRVRCRCTSSSSRSGRELPPGRRAAGAARRRARRGGAAARPADPVRDPCPSESA